MRPAAWLVALVTIAIGVVGLVSPESLTTTRRMYFATPVTLYAAAAVRLAMGLVVILSATTSRAPRVLRVIGALMCLQALSGALLGPGRAPAVLEWESVQGPALLRLGAAVALATGCFLAFALARPRALPGSHLPANTAD